MWARASLWPSALMTILRMRAGTTARLTLWLHVSLMHMINKDVHRFLSRVLAQHSSSVFGRILNFWRSPLPLCSMGLRGSLGEDLTQQEKAERRAPVVCRRLLWQSTVSE